MLFRTHIAFSLMVFVLIEKFAVPNRIIFLSVLLFFTALPDIDYYDSKIGRKVRPFSYIFNFIFKHRGIFHSLPVPFFIFLIIYLFSTELAFAALIGYLSHLFLDCFNPKGIMPFYPFSRKKIKGFIRTGSFLENLSFGCILVIVFVLA